MVEQQEAAAGFSPVGGVPVTHGSRRGIVVRGFPPESTDQDILEFAFYKAVKGDMKCGVPEISSCHFTEDMQQAYVEFVDPSGECVQDICVVSLIVITMWLLYVYVCEGVLLLFWILPTCV